MVKKILLGLLVLVVVFVVGVVVVAAMMPAEYRLVRKTTMKASPDAPFVQVNNFHNWDNWSPWAKLDPNAKVQFEGPDAGEGAKFSWNGNSDVGEGSNTIVTSKPNELVKIQLDFKRPMEGTSFAEFAFKPVGDETEVTWSMYGDNNLMGKIFSLFCNMDKMVGGQFEQGLASMKQVVETKPTDSVAPATEDAL